MASFSEEIYLCRNMDCERFPPDWDEEQDTIDNYEGDQWQKCTICDGFFNDDGLGDILFIEEEPNNTRASCNLCGKDKNIVQMKGTGQYICQAACDESSAEESSAEEEEDKNAFECDDCNYKGRNCYEQIGLTREECIVYMDLGEPDRCEDCFDKWKNTNDAVDYLKQIQQQESNVIYTKYICKYCGFRQVKDDPDCPECGKTFCMLASQESDTIN